MVWLYLSGEVGWAIFIAIWSIAAGFVTDNVLLPYVTSRGSDLPLILVLFGVVGGAVADVGMDWLDGRRPAAFSLALRRAPAM